MTTRTRRPEEHDSIPIIHIWNRLLLPLQGDIGDHQMEHAVSEVLRRIREDGAEGLVIDASGVWLVDSHLCASLGRLAAAARLMGVPSVLCGLGTEVVMTLQTMGFDVRGFRTAPGLEAALELLGITVRTTELGTKG
jgi:rsbT antagonist protein RsbS